MPLIVDTYNVLHVVGVLPPDIAGIDTAGLVDLLGRSRYRSRRIMLICDGVPPSGGSEEAAPARTGSISVHYAGPGTTADDRIAAIIRQSSAPRRLTIVSSDRAVLREGRRRRCATLDSAEFLRHLAADHLTGEPAPPARPKPAGPLAPGLPSVLPAELIAEAERLAEIGPSPPEEVEPPGPETPAPETPAPAEPRGLDLADLDLADLAEGVDAEPVIPRDILDEAEALWRKEGREEGREEGPEEGGPGAAR